MVSPTNEDIIRKVKGLLRRSEELNDDEGQSAFLLAQRMMLKNGIRKSDVELEDITNEIGSSAVTNFKKLMWWEKRLAGVIAKNFRVKMYYTDKKTNTFTYRQIMFYGFGNDVELANNMWVLANEALEYWTKQYMNTVVADVRHAYSVERRSYKAGFIDGLSEKFNSQIADLKGKHELIELMPKEVEKQYQEFSKDFGVLATPTITINELSYSHGKQDGLKIDLTKSTIDQE